MRKFLTRSRSVRRLRFFFLLFFLLSMLNHIRPWHWRVWEFTVVTKEYGHWFALLGLWFVFRFWWWRRRGWALAAVIPTILFAGPVWDTWTWEKTWREELRKGLASVETAAPADVPELLSLKTLFFGRGEARVEPRRIVYDETNGLDLEFFPAMRDGGKSPWIVVVHGGSWANGDSSQLPALSEHLALRGFAIAAINYRKAPAHRWPAQREDLTAAVAFLKAHADELGLDEGKYFLLGRSAGGQIALNAAYTANDPALKGVIAFYAPTDLTFAYESGDEDDILGSRPLLRNLMGTDPYEDPKRYDDASAVVPSEHSRVPTLLLHGRPDPLVWYKHSERLAFRLKHRGVPCVNIESYSATHGSDYNPNGPFGQVTTNAVEYFVTRLSR